LATQVGAEALEPQEVIHRSDLVFLAVPDDAVKSLADRLKWRRGIGAVHCSGVLEVADSLVAAKAGGGAIGGFHPLQTFSDTQAALRYLNGASIAVEAEDPGLLAELTHLGELVGGKPFVLPAGARAIYHASAFFTAAAIAVCLQEGMELWARLGLDAESAREALLPLLEGTTATLRAQPSPAKALSGPVARGDVGTVERHLEALRKTSPETEELYRQLSRRAIDLAVLKGTLSREAEAALRSLL
jgi:predicted short-subunit dehydrogenase-like oxidoreductase (DUF2520 family)